jgi:thiosulfate dehydrogenase
MTRMRPIIALLASLWVFQMSAPAQAQEPGSAWIISLGGRLYDNQWLVTGNQPPEGRNPAYPDAVNIADADTWRCVSCHGWDYRGNEGQLGQLSNSPVFVSLRAVAGRSPGQVRQTIETGSHERYVAGMGAGQIDALASFISFGQFNAAKLIPDGKPAGYAAAGKDIFEGACASCHQADGKAFIEGEPGDVPALGWVAQNRPAQAMHKIMNGVPGADMLSLRFLPEQSLANLLAYLATLDPQAE